MQPSIGRGLSTVGALAVVVGTYLPWVDVAADHDEVVVAIFLPGMDAGFAGLDVAALAPAVAVLLLAVRGGRRRASGWLAVGTGLVAVFLPAYHATTVVGGPFLAGLLGSGPAASGPFVPGTGAYLTALGGAVLLVGGAVRLRAPLAGERAAPTPE